LAERHGGVDMLLEARDLPVSEGPHVGNLQFGGLAGFLRFQE
jgi:hypothetical protein